MKCLGTLRSAHGGSIIRTVVGYPSNVVTRGGRVQVPKQGLNRSSRHAISTTSAGCATPPRRRPGPQRYQNKSSRPPAAIGSSALLVLSLCKVYLERFFKHCNSLNF
jgi:hypothetical protein